MGEGSVQQKPLTQQRLLNFRSSPLPQGERAQQLPPRFAEALHQNNLSDASLAPSAIDLNFAHTTSSATRPRPAIVSKPQSLPAITRCGSPMTFAPFSSRSAITSGCSTKLVVESITPATMI